MIANNKIPLKNLRIRPRILKAEAKTEFPTRFRGREFSCQLVKFVADSFRLWHKKLQN